MIFIDASAFVAIITRERGFADLSMTLEPAGQTICSALSIWETATALCRSFRYPVADARSTVADYVRDLEFRYVPIGALEYELAAQAYEKFGKGRQPAALNMGDCFAYACARANNAKLLFKGDDFFKNGYCGSVVYFPIITSGDLITAVTSSPTAKARSSTASLVMDDVMIFPPPISTRTCAVVRPFTTATIFPSIDCARSAS